MSFLVTHDKVVGTLHMQLWTRLAAIDIARSYGCCHQLWPWRAAMENADSYGREIQLWTWLAAMDISTLRGGISQKV